MTKLKQWEWECKQGTATLWGLRTNDDRMNEKDL